MIKLSFFLTPIGVVRSFRNLEPHIVSQMFILTKLTLLGLKDELLIGAIFFFNFASFAAKEH